MKKFLSRFTLVLVTLLLVSMSTNTVMAEKMSANTPNSLETNSIVKPLSYSSYLKLRTVKTYAGVEVTSLAFYDYVVSFYPIVSSYNDGPDNCVLLGTPLKCTYHVYVDSHGNEYGLLIGY